MRIGAHMSISGGLAKMAQRAASSGCQTIQIFSRSPRGGKARLLPPGEVSEMKRILGEADIRPLVVHTPYTMNLAATKQEMQEYTVGLLADDIQRTAELGAAYLVTHVGNYGQGSREEGLNRAALNLQRALEQADVSNVILLLENTAGAGTELGSTLEELLYLVELVHGHQVGLCIDTCHAFAAGWDLTRPGAVRELVTESDLVRLIHVSDSRYPRGSRRDRHANIGEGHLGTDFFRQLLEESGPLPLILETPAEGRLKDLALLRRWQGEIGRPVQE